MQFYGNTLSRIHGVVLEINGNSLKIQFDGGKEVSTPKHIIHSPFDPKVAQKTELIVESWFLKKNRVIPFDWEQQKTTKQTSSLHHLMPMDLPSMSH